MGPGVGEAEIGAVERREGELAWEWGLRLERMGDVGAATAAYAAAVDAGEEPREPRAVLRNAEQLEARGYHEGAEVLFRRAAEAGEPDVRAGAWRGIASYLIGRGEIAAGLEALEAVVATGDPDEAPRALRNIGTLREDYLGEVDGARAAYEAAIAFGHPLHSQGARVNLAQLLDKQGDSAAAAVLFREVIESGHPVECGRARTLLAYLLQEQGDGQQALEWFEVEMAAERDSEWGQRAAFGAGGIYLDRGDRDRAVEAFRIAERIDNPSEAAMATFFRGEVERERGNQDVALDAYRRAAEADGVVRCAAAKQAGTILLERNDPAAARGLLVLAAEA
ncbi:MAG TPA: tetratricopeptide repeat protein, partial [Solirubrobacterales bacterium]|nr:tetratricopeptide repeat protein [Solirubrobacterales bacterium]